MDPGDERCELAKVNPVRVKGTSLGHTDADNAITPGHVSMR